MSRLHSARILLVLAALAVGAAAWGSALIQRQSAATGREQQLRAQLLLTSMLDMETGLRGFEISQRDEFLQPYSAGRRDYDRALAALRGSISHGTRPQLEAAATAAASWQAAAQAVVAQVRRQGRRALTLAAIRARKASFDRFRRAQAQLAAGVEEDRERLASRAGLIAAAVGLLLALLVGLIGLRLMARRERQDRERRAEDRRYRETQTEFGESMQIAEDESEAHDLLRRHLERTLAGAQAVVLNRNNSHDRLEPATVVGDPVVAEHLDGARPASCLAVRLGREHARDPGEHPLLGCEICGKAAGGAICRPLLVGHEIIGAVLVTHEEPLAEQERTRLADSVRQAAPVLANLRTLAMAETRAATDALTGLPNRRAVEDTLKRMVAQASRTAQPLSALMIDLDHFKAINDSYGHERGDETLASVGLLLRDMLRASDFAGRYGGEEFIVLAPATDAAGARWLGENIRAAIKQVRVDELADGVTASIGIATFPDVADDAAGLVRLADRALYAAKERGRDRVEEAARGARPVEQPQGLRTRDLPT